MAEYTRIQYRKYPQYSFNTQSLGLEGVVNARELGGYVMPDGRRVRRGLLMRGGNLTKATDRDIDFLSGRCGLRFVFDFRSSFETSRSADREVPGARNIWMPAFDEDNQKMVPSIGLPPAAYVDLNKWLVTKAADPRVQGVAEIMYPNLVMTEFTQMQYAGFFQNVLSCDGGAVYWHCSQGKDRTGFAAAFMLAALGADRDLIYTDYAISNEIYREDVEACLSQLSTPEEAEVIWAFIGVNPRLFNEALDLIDKEYGSLMNYLTGPLCLTEEDMARLRDLYLE